MNTTIGKDEFLADISAYIARRHGTQAAAAKDWGVSAAYVSKVVKGYARTPWWLMDELGYRIERVSTLTYIKEQSPSSDYLNGLMIYIHDPD